MPVSNITLDEEELIIIKTSIWDAEIVLTNNANLIRLHHVPLCLDMLRSPVSLEELRQTPERYGMPLLFPPGRIDGGNFNWNGRTYSFPINEPENSCNLHGLLLGKPWQLNEVKEEDCKTTVSMYYDYNKNHENFSGYPHEFRLELTYIFTDDTVIQQTRLTNHGKETMPFGLGYHTAFKLPFGSRALETKQPCQVMVTTGNKRWEMSPQRRLPTGIFSPLTESEVFNRKNGREVGTEAVGMLCPAETQLVNGKMFRGAIIESPADKIKIIYEVDDEYKLWALWNDGGDKGFFCIEPLTWMSNAPNLNLPPEVTGMQFLSPGCSWQAKNKIYLKT